MKQILKAKIQRLWNTPFSDYYACDAISCSYYNTKINKICLYIRNIA